MGIARGIARLLVPALATPSDIDPTLRAFTNGRELAANHAWPHNQAQKPPLTLPEDHRYRSSLMVVASWERGDN
jgi:hypothetical protein